LIRCTILHNCAQWGDWVARAHGASYIEGRWCAGGRFFRQGCGFLGGFCGNGGGFFVRDPLRAARRGCAPGEG
jgi:hypothetical protein